MDDIATVATGVAHRQIADGADEIRVITRGDDAGAAEEFRKNSERDEDGKNQTDERVEIAVVEDEGDDSRDESCGKRPREISLERVPGSFTPSEERAYTREQEKEKRDGDIHFVKERRPHADFAAHDPLGEHRKECAPEDRETCGEENQIVEKKTGFAGDERVELIVAAEIIAVLPPSKEANHENETEEADKPGTDGGLR